MHDTSSNGKSTINSTDVPHIEEAHLVAYSVQGVIPYLKVRMGNIQRSLLSNIKMKTPKQKALFTVSEDNGKKLAKYVHLLFWMIQKNLKILD